MNFNWKEFDDICINLSHQIRQSSKQYNGVYGIPRGGVCLAVRLSHLLNIDYVPYIDNDNKQCLIVDDINDSGKTLSPFIMAGFDTATLLKRFSSPYDTTYCGGIIENDEWVIMPWECLETAQKDEQEYKSRNMATSS